VSGGGDSGADETRAKRRPPVVGIRPFWAILLLQLALAYLLLGLWFTLTGTDGINRSGNAIGVDFIQYYAASGLALDGNAAGVYDRETLFQAERQVVDGEAGKWPWSYPPTFLLVVLPLAKLPYLVALGLWLGASLALLLWVGYRMAPHPATPALVLLYPAVGNSLFSGQNGCLSAALIGAGLMLVERRPWLAGLLIGLLSYKPNLGLLIPLALIAGGHWRAFAGAAISTLAFAGLSLAVFGWAPWQGFFDNLGFVAEMIETRAATLENMPTLFALVYLVKGPLALAYGLQAAGTIAAAVFVLWLWRRPARLEVKAAGLLLALPLSAPYFQFYDLAMLALALLWLALAAREDGWRSGERTVLGLLWLTPVLLLALAIWLKLQLWPLLLLVMLALVARRAATSGRTVASRVC
jgi:hypothetical protein